MVHKNKPNIRLDTPSVTNKGTIKNKDPSHKIVIGKLYANWCIHCQNLIPIWKKFKNEMKLKDKNILFIEIEDTDIVNGLEYVNQTYLMNSNEKLNANDGYPTLFKIINGNLSYFKGTRDMDSIFKWATENISVANTNIGGNNVNKTKKSLFDRTFFYFLGGKKKTSKKHYGKNKTKKQLTKNK